MANLLEGWIAYQRIHGKGGKGVSACRIKKYGCIYRGLERLGGTPLPKVLSSKKNLEALVGKINRSKYEAWTKSDYKILLKQLWKMQNGLEQTERPKETEWIKTGVSSSEKKLPKNLITQSEAQKMVATSKSARDKSLVMLLFECGLRVGEVATLKKSSLQFIEKGVRLNVKGKTGERRILAVDTAPYLANWLNQHPTKGEDYVFVGEHWIKNPKQGRKHVKVYCMITEAGIAKILRQVAEAAGLTKHIYPHLFRHSCATRLAKYLSEQELKSYFGWTPNSHMASVYVHLSGEDVDDALLRMHGMTKPKEAEENKLAPRICKRCAKQNSSDASLCQYCGLPFDKEKAMRDELAMQEEMAAMRKEQATTRKQLKQLLDAQVDEKEKKKVKND